jgi:hypothetical protein
MSFVAKYIRKVCTALYTPCRACTMCLPAGVVLCARHKMRACITRYALAWACVLPTVCTFSVRSIAHTHAYAKPSGLLYAQIRGKTAGRKGRQEKEEESEDVIKAKDMRVLEIEGKHCYVALEALSSCATGTKGTVFVMKGKARLFKEGNPLVYGGAGAFVTHAHRPLERCAACSGDRAAFNTCYRRPGVRS